MDADQTPFPLLGLLDQQALGRIAKPGAHVLSHGLVPADRCRILVGEEAGRLQRGSEPAHGREIDRSEQGGAGIEVGQVPACIFIPPGVRWRWRRWWWRHLGGNGCGSGRSAREIDGEGDQSRTCHQACGHQPGGCGGGLMHRERHLRPGSERNGGGGELACGMPGGYLAGQGRGLG